MATLLNFIVEFVKEVSGMPNLQDILIREGNYLKGKVVADGLNYYLIAFDIKPTGSYTQEEVVYMVKHVLMEFITMETNYHAIREQPRPSEVYQKYLIDVN